MGSKINWPHFSIKRIGLILFFNFYIVEESFLDIMESFLFIRRQNILKSKVMLADNELGSNG